MTQTRRRKIKAKGPRSELSRKAKLQPDAIMREPVQEKRISKKKTRQKNCR